MDVRNPTPLIAVSIGGSILVPGENDGSYIEALSGILKDVASESKMIIVVGGGRIARRYQSMARELGASDIFLDELGIEATRLNAMLLIAGLGELCHPTVVRNLDEAAIAIRTSGVIVSGGTHPGHTTDAVAAMMAVRLGAQRFINATSVDGVYDKDPAVHNDAVRIPGMNYDELLSLVMPYAGRPGANVVLDPLAVKVLSQSRIDTLVVNGRELANLRLALEGDPGVTGTFVTHGSEGR